MKVSKLKKFIDTSYVDQMVSHSLLLDILNEGGFWLLKKGDRNICYVKLSEGIVDEVITADMKEYILERIKASNFSIQKKNVVRELIHQKASKLFSKDHLEMLPVLKLNLLKDNRETSYLCYKNGIVKVTDDNVNIKPYKELKSHIWKSQIIKRNFIHKGSVDQEALCEFEIFMQNICNKDQERLKSLKSILGYLLHDFKDPGKPYAIILLDEKIPTQDNTPNGRLGKGILVQATSKLRKTLTEDGKRFNSKRVFTFQSVTIDTKLFVLDDVGIDFKFEDIFSLISEGLSFEQKYLTKFIIPFSESPKIILTSNYILPGQGSSHRGRKIEFELASYYNDEFSPEDEFGHLFFNDWESEEWNKFDNLMISCLQLYLKEGLIKPKEINKSIRLLAQETTLAFAHFAKDKIVVGTEYISSELFQEFLNHLQHNDEDDDQPSSTMFTKYLKMYARIYNLQFKSRLSNSKKHIQFLHC